ncbi:dynein axonemal assembly factor 8 [Labrus mixtus]|uniref:dynein axonemal assembly factor 8 n=1 Tax=Labrus mixtus TaxID=508554 RepID=UPI0029C03026|nr:dynein axonemal assembly factor 8 [Labrus mixtus]
MDKLVAFLRSQSSQPVKSQNPIRQKKAWSKSTERQRSQQECPTVYIDLRSPDPLIKQPKPSQNLSSGFESPAKHNTHQEPPAKNLKVQTGSQVGRRDMTGKSMLLRTMRELENNGNIHQNMCKDSLHSLQSKAAGQLHENLKPLEFNMSRESQYLKEEKQPSHTGPELDGRKTNHGGKMKKQKHQSDQQGRQVGQTSQHEHHHLIFKQLERHRPTTCVNQRQPAAEKTDTLYHSEASHLQQVSTLPADMKSKVCMILIVNLSGPGMVGDGGHLYPAATKSHIYNTLVAWFLSLVGPNSCHDDDDAGAKVPFWVAGLQQQWTEDGLALHVLAVTRHSYTPNKKQRDVHPLFYTQVCRFLSETTLPLVAFWLPQLQILLDRECYASTIRLPSSCLNSFISTSSKKKLIDKTFGLSPGFYWQTVESQENVCNGRDSNLELHTEVSVALGCIFLDPLITHYTLQLVLNSGLDVCGLRLLHSAQKLQNDSAGAEPVLQSIDPEICHPALALAVRGPHAHSVFRDLTRSLDVFLPRESTSGSQQRHFLSSPQLASQVHRELCLWFSGRLPGKKAQKHNRPLNGIIPAHNRDKGRMSNAPSFLCATTKADLLLVVSPVVPPCCYGQVLAVCERRGFGLMGLQRLQLQSHGADVLGLSNQQALVFCGQHNVILDQKEQERPNSHCLLLILRKENAVHHGVSLPAALMREVKVLDGVDTVGADLCYHTVPYSSELSCISVKHMWALPDPSRVILSCHKCSSTSDTEQVVMLSLCGKDMSKGLSLLHRVLTARPKGFKLLSLKFLPVLTQHQAKELTPYEVGERLCVDSVNFLMSSPVLVCALSRVEAFSSLKKRLPHDYPGNLSVLMSATPEVASRQASVFFLEHEMTPDQSKQSQLNVSPQICSTKDPQRQLTVCLFKPRSWYHLVSAAVHILHLSGLRVVGLRVFTLEKSTAACILPAESDTADLEAQVEYLCSGSSLALCLEGEDAVRRLLDVIGHMDSSHWMMCSAIAHSYNPIYGSGSYQKAVEDVKKLFPGGLCCAESSTMTQEKIFSLCSDSVASVEREQTSTLAPVAREHLPLSLESGPNKGSLVHRAYWQTTCLLVPFDAPPLSHESSQLELLGLLLRSGCYLVAGRMSVLDNKQRKHITETLQVSSRGNERMAQLNMAPCLILALQGENVATRLNLRLENSINKERPDLDKVGQMIIYPENEKEAEQLICYLFDTLSPESSHHIVPKGSNRSRKSSIH